MILRKFSAVIYLVLVIYLDSLEVQLGGGFLVNRGVRFRIGSVLCR